MGLFLFLPVLAISLVLYLAVKIGKSASVKGRAVLGVASLAILCFLVPEAFSYAAYMMDAPRYQGGLRACEHYTSQLQRALDEYGEEENAPPTQLSALVPKYLEEVPNCPGHILFGAARADRIPEQAYRLERGKVKCPNPADPPTFAMWKMQKKVGL